MSTDTTAAGVIHDIGYQRYTGERLGRGYSARSLYTHGVRTAFGLGRSAKAKIFPWMVVGIVGLVAVVAHRGPGADRRGAAELLGLPGGHGHPGDPVLRGRRARAGLAGHPRRGAAALLLAPADPHRLRAGQVRRAGHRDVPAAGRAAAAHVHRRSVHPGRHGRTSGASSSTSARACPRRRCTRCLRRAGHPGRRRWPAGGRSPRRWSSPCSWSPRRSTA